MHHFSYRQGQLFCEEVSLDELAARVGTPLYVYSKETLREHYQRFTATFAAISPEVRFSVKSCWNTHILRLLGEWGAGMDVVSGGELYRALRAGIAPEKVVAAGVGKTQDELRYILETGVGWLNVESEQEFELAARLARELGVRRRAALRVNPDVADPRTPAKTTTGKKGSKFGVDLERAEAFFRAYGRDEYLRLEGLHAHLGSPIYEAKPYLEGLDRLLPLVDKLAGLGFKITTLDLGGGFAADYDSTCPSWDEYAGPLARRLAPFLERGGKIIFEPGRTISANAAVLLTTVQYTKKAGTRNVVIVDGGMSDLIRPSMYDAYHFMWPTRVKPELTPTNFGREPVATKLDDWDIVGPICESGDYFALGRKFPETERGERVALFGAGAYGIVLASNYNSRPRPAEVLVDGARATLIRRRETYADLIALEERVEPVAL